MIEDYRSRKPKSEDHKSNLKNNGLNSQQENLAGKPKKKLKHRKEEKEAPKIIENAEKLSQVKPLCFQNALEIIIRNMDSRLKGTLSRLFLNYLLANHSTRIV